MNYLKEDNVDPLVDQTNPIWSGTIARDVASLTEMAYATLDNTQEANSQIGPCRWQSRDNFSTPHRGDKCLVAFDSGSNPWIMAWWPPNAPPSSTPADFTYNGAFPVGTPYNDGDIVVYNGIAYLCVRPTSTAPTPWTVPQGISMGLWQAFTPTWASESNPQPAIGNGSMSGRYTQIGKTVHLIGHWIAGTTTTYGNGTWMLGLPIPAINYFQSALGNAWAFRSGVGNFPQMICRISGAGVGYAQFLYGGATWPTGLIQGLSNVPPWGGSWANQDTLDWAMTYECA